MRKCLVPLLEKRGGEHKLEYNQFTVQVASNHVVNKDDLMRCILGGVTSGYIRDISLLAFCSCVDSPFVLMMGVNWWFHT